MRARPQRGRDLVIRDPPAAARSPPWLRRCLPHHAVGHGRHGEGLRHRRRIGAPVGEGERTSGVVRRASEVSSRDHGEGQAELDRQPQAPIVPGVAERLPQRGDRHVEAVLMVVNFPQQPKRTGPD